MFSLFLVFFSIFALTLTNPSKKGVVLYFYQKGTKKGVFLYFCPDQKGCILTLKSPTKKGVFLYQKGGVFLYFCFSLFPVVPVFLYFPNQSRAKKCILIYFCPCFSQSPTKKCVLLYFCPYYIQSPTKRGVLFFYCPYSSQSPTKRFFLFQKFFFILLLPLF